MVYVAQQQCQVNLIEAQESYLIFLLMRFVNRPQLANSVVAMDFLHAMHEQGRWRQHQLQAVGDKCLLLSGLFPGWAQRKRVRISYFVALGQSAFLELSACEEDFYHVAEGFLMMMDVLQALRPVAELAQQLMPLATVEMLENAASQSAQQVFSEYSDGFLILAQEKRVTPSQH